MAARTSRRGHGQGASEPMASQGEAAPKRRRGRNEGSLFYDETRARWVGKVIVGYAGGRPIRRAVVATTVTEARRKLDALRRRHEDGLPVGDGRLTVGAFLERWVREVLPARGLSPNTVANYRWAVGTYLVPSLGRVMLRELSPEDVEKLLRERAAAGMSRNSLNRIRSVLSLALRHAERGGYVARNVAHLVDTPQGPAKPLRSLTVPQARRLLEAARGDRLEALWTTGLMMGLRPGELLGLRWEDVDLERRRLTVAVSLKREPAGARLGPPKAASGRVLDMPGPVLEQLRSQRAVVAAARLAAGVEWEDWDLVFPSASGRPIDHSNLRRSFARLTEAAGLGRWHPHELRHSAASILSASGLRLEDVADVLGHRDLRTTDRVYRHAITESIGAGVSAMERTFASESGGAVG